MAREVHKNTKLRTANEGDDNDVIGFIMTVLGAAFRTKVETTCPVCLSGTTALYKSEPARAYKHKGAFA